MRSSKQYFNYLYHQGKYQFDELDQEDKEILAGRLILEGSNDDLTEILVNLESPIEIMILVATYMTTADHSAKYDAWELIQKQTADFYKNRINELFELYSGEFQAAEYEEVPEHKRPNYQPPQTSYSL